MPVMVQKAKQPEGTAQPLREIPKRSVLENNGHKRQLRRGLLGLLALSFEMIPYQI
jgi:hypothetical protein